jgi:hypothetical protein
LADPVEHHRTLVWLPRSGVVVVDRLRSRRAHAIRTRLHVAPGVRCDGANGLAGFDVVALGGGDVRHVEAAYSPFLGRKVPIDVLEDVRTVEPDTPFGWSVLRKGARVARLELDRVEVSLEGHSTLTVPLEWA